MTEHEIMHIWAVSSGWEGPFQKEEVIVIASSQDAARQAAEAAFAAQTQPICRAKMHIADLGFATEGAVTPARTTGELFANRGVHIDARCDPPPGGEPQRVAPLQ
jgi:hypothetical protein